MKKVLAWAVALALVLSSFTMAFAADAPNSSQFKDASSINYTEAVDVMVATGIINGFPDGTFGPQKTVKRSEMAKMIACIMNGGEDVGDQFKSACPFADSKDHWAAGYIAFCASEHIIDGRSADVFDPEAEVTGTEVAKMALTALGYDSKIQGYTGENWAAAVLKDAKKIELFDGLDSSFVPGDPCNRESAAQILFNMLQANMVEYENGTSVSVGDDVNVVVSSKVQDQTWKPGVDGTANAKDDNGDGYKQLYEEVFGGDLSREASAEGDDYGRTGHDWSYEDEPVGTYGDSADVEFVAEKNQTIEKAIADYNEDYTIEANATFVVNGVSNGMSKDTKVPAGTTIEVTKKGTKVTGVVAYYYELVKITEVDTDVTAQDEKDGVAARVSYAGKEISGNDVKDTDFTGFDASTYEKDSYVAVFYNKAKSKIVESFVPEVKSGDITTATKAALTVDGTDYTMSVEKGASPFYAGSADAIKAGKSVDLYLDKNEYAIGSVEQEAESDFLYGVVTDVTTSSGASSLTDDADKTALKNKTYSILDAEGNTNNYKLASDYIDDIVAGDKTLPSNDGGYIEKEGKSVFIGFLVKYTVDEDGNIDSMSATYDATGQAAKMDEDGILNGTTMVSEDVAVFEYNTSDEEWNTFKFDNLVDEQLTASWFAEDGEVVAMATSGLIDSTNEVLGFFESAEVKSDKDGWYAVINIYENGSDKTTPYETKRVETEPADNAYDYATDELILLSLNKDGQVASIAEEDAFVDVDDPAKEFPDGTKAIAYDTAYTVVDAVDGTNVTLDGTIMTIKKAKVYKAYYDTEDNLLLKSASASSILEGGYVKLYQINPDSNAWDVVVYMSAADYTAHN